MHARKVENTQRSTHALESNISRRSQGPDLQLSIRLKRVFRNRQVPSCCPSSEIRDNFHRPSSEVWKIIRYVLRYSRYIFRQLVKLRMKRRALRRTWLQTMTIYKATVRGKIISAQVFSTPKCVSHVLLKLPCTVLNCGKPISEYHKKNTLAITGYIFSWTWKKLTLTCCSRGM